MLSTEEEEEEEEEEEDEEDEEEEEEDTCWPSLTTSRKPWGQSCLPSAPAAQMLHFFIGGSWRCRL